MNVPPATAQSAESSLCGNCGYDLGGLATTQAPTCPECGAVAGSWRSACAAPWLVVPALRLLAWGVPVLIVVICLARFIDDFRGVRYPGFIVSSDALLLYSIPLVACLAGVGLLSAGSPGSKRARALTISLVVFAIACVGATVSGRYTFREYWVGAGPSQKLSVGLDLSMGAFAGRAGILATAASGVACVILLARLASELGWRWFALWRSRLTTGIAIAFIIALGVRQLVQAIVVAGIQGTALGSFNPSPVPRTWADSVLLGLSAALVALIWSLVFATLARIRSCERVTTPRYPE
jgi:hypothetical protein